MTIMAFRRMSDGSHPPSGTDADHVVFLRIADAGNRWLHTELTDEGLEPWGGVKVIAVAGSPEPTHYVDVSGEHFEASVHSLEAHAAYNAALPSDFPAPRELLGWILGGGGKAAGVEHALLLDVIRRG